MMSNVKINAQFTIDKFSNNEINYDNGIGGTLFII